MMEENKNCSLSLNDAAEQYFNEPDQGSLQALVAAASALIQYFSHLYGGGCESEELFQTGSLGLMKAIKSFDKNAGAKFSTYASHMIMGEIRHMVRKQASYYRPGCIIELQFKVDKEIEEYTRLHGEVPSPAIIACRLNLREESISEVMKAGVISYDEIDITKIHSLTLESFKLPIEDILTLHQALRKLTDLQQKIVQMLFYQDMTQQQVAEKMAMTQKQVSRIKERSLRELRQTILSKD